MSKLISSFFTQNGNPATGLSPSIRIWDVTDLSNNLIVSNGSMVEVGDGFYAYNFTAYDTTKDYLFRTDGGSSLSIGERYQKASSQNSSSDVWESQTSDYNESGTFGLKVNQIAADTSQSNTNILIAINVLDILLKYQTNRTKVNPSTNTLTIYDDDGTTVLQVFNLLDENQQPSIEKVFERVPE